MPALSCPLCQNRRAKRACPALGRDICPVCCGTKRLVEISCPPTCSYLSSAKAHPPAVVQRRQERDLGFLLPFLMELSERQHQLIRLFQAMTLRHAAVAMPPLLDADVAAAAAAAAATLETARSGIIYQHQATSLPAQRLSTELQNAFEELVRQSGGTAPPSLERDAATVFRALERMARQAASALPDDEPPVFLRLLGRVLTDQEPGSDQEQPPDPGSRLIIPG